MLSAEYIESQNEEEILEQNQVPLDSNEIKIKKKKDDLFYYDEGKGLIRKSFNKKNLMENQIRVKLVPYEKDFYTFTFTILHPTSLFRISRNCLRQPCLKEK